MVNGRFPVGEIFPVFITYIQSTRTESCQRRSLSQRRSTVTAAMSPITTDNASVGHVMSRARVICSRTEIDRRLTGTAVYEKD